MKSIGVYVSNELVSRHVLKEETVTVGNHTCDIPIPNEERLLFAIEMRKDEVLGYLYLYEQMPIKVNGKVKNQSPIEISVMDKIEIDTGVQIEILPDTMTEEQGLKEKSTVPKSEGTRDILYYLNKKQKEKA